MREIKARDWNDSLDKDKGEKAHGDYYTTATEQGEMKRKAPSPRGLQTQLCVPLYLALTAQLAAAASQPGPLSHHRTGKRLMRPNICQTHTYICVYIFAYALCALFMN